MLHITDSSYLYQVVFCCFVYLHTTAQSQSHSSGSLLIRGINFTNLILNALTLTVIIACMSNYSLRRADQIVFVVPFISKEVDNTVFMLRASSDCNKLSLLCHHFTHLKMFSHLKKFSVMHHCSLYIEIGHSFESVQSSLRLYFFLSPLCYIFFLFCRCCVT